MRLHSSLTTAVLWLCAIAPALAQSEQSEPPGPTLGEARTSRWRIGMIVTASGGACHDLSGYVPVPTDWPEQYVSTVKEDVSPEAEITYEMIDGGAMVMNVEIPRLASGRTAKALVTFDIRRSVIVPPGNHDVYVLSDPKKLPNEIRCYLAPSPKIESRAPEIRELAKTLGADTNQKNAWERVETLYDWVCQNVTYEDGLLKGALAALHDRTGHCEERSALFIALCRAAGIPARTVWVPNHCYSEFYLRDDEGQGHWFPCQSAGTPTFGGITEFLPILQKGDNFRPPKPGMERQRYMAEFLTGMPSPDGGKPQVEFIREEVPE